MWAYCLKSDNEFVVYRYYEIIRVCYFINDKIDDDMQFIDITENDEDVDDYRALQVFDVTIEGGKLKQLVTDLKEIGNEKFDVFVNRLGHCKIVGTKPPYTKKTMLVKGYFTWSKYGVELPRAMIGTPTMRTEFEMRDGKIVMDVQGIFEVVEEADKELGWRLEAKSMELAICKKELEWSKKLVERKEKEVEIMKSQFSGFKAALRSLVDH